MKVDTLILAGGRNEGKLKEYSPENHEALIKINNIPMIEYVISAVKAAQNTARVAVVGPKNDLEKSIDKNNIDKIIKSSNSIIDNIDKGIDELKPENYVFIVTSDIPLITSEIIDEFICYCRQKKADIYYPVISKQKNLEKFPDSGRTYVRLNEGTFTGGNIVVVKPHVLKESLEVLRKVMAWRKKPWKLGTILGFKFIIKLFFGKLSLQEIENRVSEIIGYKSLSLIIEYPEIGFDIDKPSDLRIMNKYIS